MPGLILRPGVTIDGRYEITKVLGMDARGCHVVATQKWTGRDVSVEVLDPRLAHRAEAIHRFRRHAQALVRLRHRGVADVLDMVLDMPGAGGAGLVFLTTELLDGPTLSAEVAMSMGQPMTFAQATARLMPVVEAIAAAHDKGMAHGELDADAVVITKDDFGGMAAKLRHFGSAEFPLPADQSIRLDALKRTDVAALLNLFTTCMTGTGIDGKGRKRLLKAVECPASIRPWLIRALSQKAQSGDDPSLPTAQELLASLEERPAASSFPLLALPKGRSAEEPEVIPVYEIDPSGETLARRSGVPARNRVRQLARLDLDHTEAPFELESAPTRPSTLRRRVVALGITAAAAAATLIVLEFGVDQRVLDAQSVDDQVERAQLSEGMAPRETLVANVDTPAGDNDAMPADENHAVEVHASDAVDDDVVEETAVEETAVEETAAEPTDHRASRSSRATRRAARAEQIRAARLERLAEAAGRAAQPSSVEPAPRQERRSEATEQSTHVTPRATESAPAPAPSAAPAQPRAESSDTGLIREW